MEWLFTLIIVGVIVAVVFAARGRLGTMPEVVDDQPGIDLPEGALTGDDLMRLELGLAPRGYRQDQVDALLNRIAKQLGISDPELLALAEQGVVTLQRPPAEPAGETESAAETPSTHADPESTADNPLTPAATETPADSPAPADSSPEPPAAAQPSRRPKRATRALPEGSE